MIKGYERDICAEIDRFEILRCLGYGTEDYCRIASAGSDARTLMECKNHGGIIPFQGSL